MQLTGKQIVEKGILTERNGGAIPAEDIQQQGVDVRVWKIYEVEGSYMGKIPSKGKTQKLQWREKKTRVNPDSKREEWILGEGFYELALDAGCNMQDRYAGYFKSRSSIVRCGGEIRSGQYDAGFVTSDCGCFLKVDVPMIIERGAAVAQFIVHESEPVENTYNGQYQNTKPAEA